MLQVHPDEIHFRPVCEPRSWIRSHGAALCLAGRWGYFLLLSTSCLPLLGPIDRARQRGEAALLQLPVRNPAVICDMTAQLSLRKEQRGVV